MNTFTLPAKAAVKVCVTGGAGSVGTYLCHFIAEGAMLGRDQPIELRILELSKEKSEGVLMELNDCAYPLLVSVIGTENEKDAFTDVVRRVRNFTSSS